jgi:hypothetical protein
MQAIAPALERTRCLLFGLCAPDVLFGVLFGVLLGVLFAT